ncbi:MAG TPA: DUF4912 domain-containing protein [Trichocoleus sp.]
MPYKTPSILAALLLSVPLAQGLATTSQAQLLQVASSEFPRPESVPSGTRLRVGSSPSMAALSQALKGSFETAYAGSEIAVEADSSDDAIANLAAGDIDLAAIGRPLSAAEKSQGLVEVPINREKIAIIIGPDNAFSRSLTFEQFARIFRGEITNWSQVGGQSGPIRFVDRPETSDTRQALSGYDVFKGAPFEAGATATPVAVDDTAAVIQELGSDGISYAIANHVLDQDGVKILPMHGTLPDDPRYPYSQPRGYVYRGEPSPAVAAFLGYVTSAQGQTAIAAARRQEAAAVADALEDSTTTATADSAEAETAAPPASDPSTAEPTTTEATASGVAGETATNQADSERRGIPVWLWWLLPLALLGWLLWSLSRKRDRAGVSTAEAPPWPAEPSVTAPGPEPAPPVAPDPTLPGLTAPAAPVESSVPLETTGTLESAALGTAALGATALGAAALGSTSSEVTSETVSEAPPEAPSVAPADSTESVEAPDTPLPSDAAVTVDTPSMPVTNPATSSGSQAPPLPTMPPSIPTAAGAAGLAAGAAGLAAGAAGLAAGEDQSRVEASKYNVVGRPVSNEGLSDVDQGLSDLPDGYGESRIVLLPRDPQWAYAYWDIPNEHKEELRRQGGERLALRLYDVTDIDSTHETPHNLQQYDCEELARDWYLPIPVSDRDYLAEIGYLTIDGHWLVLARSNPIHIPPVYPSDWVENHFLTVSWNEDLRGKTLFTLTHPRHQSSQPLHEELFTLAQSAESMRIDGSLYGSMQHVPGSLVPQQAVSSYIFPSGAGLWEFPTVSGALPTLSGIGFAASVPPIRPRKFWLVADAELIVHGATEPDATVTIGGQPIQLGPDGAFRFQLSFQDGNLDYPIMAVANDGEQTRSIHMSFERETPERRTNTAEEAQDEWPPV